MPGNSINQPIRIPLGALTLIDPDAPPADVDRALQFLSDNFVSIEILGADTDAAEYDIRHPVMSAELLRLELLGTRDAKVAREHLIKAFQLLAERIDTAAGLPGAAARGDVAAQTVAASGSSSRVHGRGGAAGPGAAALSRTLTSEAQP